MTASEKGANVENNERGFTLWFTGLSGSGKTPISEIVEKELRERGSRVEVLDGDIVRTNLSKGLGFSRRQGHEHLAYRLCRRTPHPQRGSGHRLGHLPLQGSPRPGAAEDHRLNRGV